MTDPTSSETKITADPSNLSCCRRKRVLRITVGVVVGLLILSPWTFYFCPNLSAMHAGAGMQPVAQIETQLSSIETRLVAVETKLRAVNASPQTQAVAAQADNAASQPADFVRMQADLVALSSALNALQTEVKQDATTTAQTRDATHAMLASAVGFIQLREAALSGRAFNAELTAMRTAAGGDASLQEPLTKLEPYAAQSVPTFAQMREELMSREAGAANSIEKTQAQSWWQRVVVELKSLVSIRPLHGNEQADAFAALDMALQKADVVAALDAFNALPAEAQQSLGDMKTKLLAKADIDAALHNLAAHFTASPTGQAVP